MVKWYWRKTRITLSKICPSATSSSYGSTAQFGPWPPLWGFITIAFLQGWIVSPAPNPQPGRPASVFMTPGDRVVQLYPQALGTHFSRLLRHAWVTVGLFFNPAHHKGPVLLCPPQIPHGLTRARTQASCVRRRHTPLGYICTIETRRLVNDSLAHRGLRAASSEYVSPKRCYLHVTLLGVAKNAIFKR
jgi:hypothetical protein